MDSLTQASAYLQPTLEYASKLGSIVTLWLLLVVMDKHLLGLPLLKGSLWHSPRIPPRFSIKGRSGAQTTSSSNLNERSTGNGSDGPVPEEVAPFDSSSTERDFAGFKTATHQPTHTPHPSHDSSSVSASSSSTLSIYQPLEEHDPFNTSSQWLQSGFVECAVLLVLVFAFLRWFLFGKNEPIQARKISNIDTSTNDPLDQQTVAKMTEFYWESTLGELGLGHSEILAGDYFTQSGVPSQQELSDPGPQSTAILNSPVTLTPASFSPPQASSPSSNVAVDKASSPRFVHAISTFTPLPSSMTLPRTSIDSAQGTCEEALLRNSIDSAGICEEAGEAILTPESFSLSQTSSQSSDVIVDMASSPPFVHAPSIVTSPTSCMTPVLNTTESAQNTREEAGGVGEPSIFVEDGVVVPEKEKQKDCNSVHKEVEDKDDSERQITGVIAIAAKEETKDLNDGSKRNEEEAEKGDGKEDWETGRTEIISEEELSNPGDIPENEGPDEVAAVTEVKPKKKRIRQNAKRRQAKRFLAEAARQAEAAQRPEEARLAEEAQLTEEARQATEARLVQEVHRTAEARQAEETRQAGEAQLVEDTRQGEEGNTEVGEAHNALTQDTNECEGEVGEAEEVEPEPSDTPNNDLGGAMDAARKKPRRRQRKRKPKNQVSTDT